MASEPALREIQVDGVELNDRLGQLVSYSEKEETFLVVSQMVGFLWASQTDRLAVSTRLEASPSPWFRLEKRSVFPCVSRARAL